MRGTESSSTRELCYNTSSENNDNNNHTKNVSVDNKEMVSKHQQLMKTGIA